MTEAAARSAYVPGIDGLRAFMGLSNFAMVSADDGYFAPRAEFNPYTHTWSLAVEEQFYLLFPVLLFFWVAFPLSSFAAPAGRRVRCFGCCACLHWRGAPGRLPAHPAKPIT